MRKYLISGLLIVLTTTAFRSEVIAQNRGEFPFAARVQAPQAINIPMVRGATVMSTRLTALAHVQSSQAQMLTSQAYANLINAHARIANIQANRDDLRYHAERVSSYFDLREMNRQRRAELNPPMHMRAQKADQLMHELVLKQPEHLLRQSADISGRLNWLFDRVITRSFEQGIINGEEGLFVGEGFKQIFSADDIAKIYVQRRASVAGDHFRHKITNANLSRQPLPPIFNFDVLVNKAEAYLVARKHLTELLTRNDKTLPAIQEWESVYDKLDDLKRTLNNREFVVSLSPGYQRLLRQGKLFISSQGAALQLALETGNGDYLIGMPVFSGETLGEMLFFMSQNGYEFSSSEVDGKEVYERIFYSLRDVFVDLN
tara:strand:- start:25 stop:1146 length:1122 start_codon:yes stop_codon:yes gene_type:complete